MDLAENGKVEWTMTKSDITPDHIMEIGTGFFASKTLLSAVDLNVFTTLSDNPLRLEEVEDELDLHERSSRDFLDALVALDLLERKDGVYRNTPEAEEFLVESKPTYLGGLFQMANDRLYPFWANLSEALQTGEPQNEMNDPNEHPFKDAIYEDDDNLEQFVSAMTGISLGSAKAIAQEFPWQDYDSVCDLGTSEGIVPELIAMENDHITGIGYDLPNVQKYFEKATAESPVADRLRFESGDFFEDGTFPDADVYVFGHILHDWGLSEKKMLLEKAYQSLPEDGAVIVYGSMIDNERRENAPGLLMSLNMLIESPDGFDYTPADCESWMYEAGFEETRVEDLPGAEVMVVAKK